MSSLFQDEGAVLVLGITVFVVLLAIYMKLRNEKKSLMVQKEQMENELHRLQFEDMLFNDRRK